MYIFLPDFKAYPSANAAFAVRDFPALLSSGSHHSFWSNRSNGICTAQFFPSSNTFQKLSSPSPRTGRFHLCTQNAKYIYIYKKIKVNVFSLICLPPGKLHPMPTIAISKSLSFMMT